MINCFTGAESGSLISNSFKFFTSIPAIALMAIKENCYQYFLNLNFPEEWYP
jgi:hypothetical protein